MTNFSTARDSMRTAWQFARRVLSSFLKNKGLLLASALSDSTLLSLVPLSALLLVILSHIYDEQWLADLLLSEFGALMPGQTDVLASQMRDFLGNREVIGWVGFVVLLFFSSWAFRSLEDAFAVIFHRRPGARRLWISAVIPYAFVFVLGLGLFLQAVLVTLLEELSDAQLGRLGEHLTAAELSTVFIALLTLETAAIILLLGAQVIAELAPPAPDSEPRSD
jgi:membrane protein